METIGPDGHRRAPPAQAGRHQRGGREGDGTSTPPLVEHPVGDHEVAGCQPVDQGAGDTGHGDRARFAGRGARDRAVAAARRRPAPVRTTWASLPPTVDGPGLDAGAGRGP